MRKSKPDGRASNGGARPNSGALPRSATLRLGQRVGVSERSPAGFAPIVGGKIVEIKRGAPRVVVVEMDDGSELRIMI